jgi:putative hydrolases of HD superfamily
MNLIPTEFSKDFVMSEVAKLQYLYGLKREIRYGQTRPEGDLTESVAEHIYGMHLLIHYFLPLENPAGDWDKLRIFSMATMHDFDEIETGDTISYLKTSYHYDEGIAATAEVIRKVPDTLRESVTDYLTEYNERKTVESQFVKAIDAFEPLIQMYSDFGRDIIAKNQQGAEQAYRVKHTPIQPFSIMYKYFSVIHTKMIEEGFFPH